VRTHFLVAIVMTLVVIAASSPQRRPTAPGIREGEAQINKPLEPPLSPKKHSPNAAQLKREADELARLSASIPDQVALVAKGLLPKDLTDQLKRIEKLSKHLRSEISE